MASLCVRMEDEDLELLRKTAGEMRVPYTILARMFIVKGLKEGFQTEERGKTN